MSHPREWSGPRNWAKDSITARRWQRPLQSPSRGGRQQPESCLQGITSISRSDSIVTVPIYQVSETPTFAPAGLHRNRDDCGFLAARNYSRTQQGQPNGQVEGRYHERCRLQHGGWRNPGFWRWSVCDSCAADSPITWICDVVTGVHARPTWPWLWRAGTLAATSKFKGYVEIGSIVAEDCPGVEDPPAGRVSPGLVAPPVAAARVASVVPVGARVPDRSR